MSGVVKGIKKAFKAIGNVLKKVWNNKIFRTVLMIGAAIFTGGAAAAAFGALGSGAGLGAAVSAGLSGGMSALGSAVGAVTGGIQSLLGIGTSSTAAAAPIAEGVAVGGAEAAGAAAGEGVIAGGADLAGAAASAEAAAPWAGTGSSWAAADPGAMGLAGGEAGSAASGLTQAAQPGSGWQLMQQPSAQWTPPGGVDAAQTFASNPPGSYGASIGAQPSASSFGLPNDSWASDTLSKAWKFFKPETPDGYKMWGNVLMGVGQGAMAGRQADAQREWHEKMTAVPDITKTFEQKPGYRWALMGGK